MAVQLKEAGLSEQRSGRANRWARRVWGAEEATFSLVQPQTMAMAAASLLAEPKRSMTAAAEAG